MMYSSKNVVYLYSEVMPYAISVMRSLVHDFGMQVDCICWDTKKRTPFVPEDEEGIRFHKRSSFDTASIRKFIEDREPPLMYIVGRMDRLYMDTAVHFRDRSHIVTASDNQWTGSKKQWLGALLSKWLYKRYFEYFWVPGPRQYEFARRIGYPTNRIIINHLTGDAPVYNGAYHAHRQAKQAQYPHNMVFAGRFAKVKGLDILMKAFIAAKEETNNDWELTLVGSGDIPVSDVPYIKVRAFMSGQQLADESRNWGVFCLPSTKEPWGVVIHEFAMLGMPIICSDNVGAADTLVIKDFNGYVFPSGDIAALKKAIMKVMASTDEQLRTMGDNGHQLSKMHSPAIAAYSFLSAVRER